MFSKSVAYSCTPRMHQLTCLGLALLGAGIIATLLFFLPATTGILTIFAAALGICLFLIYLPLSVPKVFFRSDCAAVHRQLNTNNQCRNIAAHLPDLIWSIDFANRNVTALNQAYSGLHPQPGEKETRLTTILPARVSRLFLENLIKVQNQPETIRFEYQIGTEGKNPDTFEARLTAVSRNECVALIREISHIKATEEALINQQIFLQQIVENSPSLIFVRDKHGRFLLVNRATQATLGHDLLAQSHSGLPDSQIPFMTGDQEVLRSGETAQIIEQITLPDGRSRRYEVTKLPLIRDNETYLLCIAMDITHFHSSEAAELGADAFIRAIVEYLPTAFALLDHGHIVFANKAACALLGGTPDALIGASLADFSIRDTVVIRSQQDVDCAGMPVQLLVLEAKSPPAA